MQSALRTCALFNAKRSSLVVVWALWPHYALRMSGCVESQCCSTCLGESMFMGYKYECLAYLDVYQAALTRRRTPKHACLQIVLYIYIYIFALLSYRALYSYDSTLNILIDIRLYIYIYFIEVWKLRKFQIFIILFQITQKYEAFITFILQLKTFETMLECNKGPFIIYDRGWAGKIQLTNKQNVLPHPLHHKNFNDPLHMNSKK
jgi:hypothetical protein